ncbi:amidohydrolase family protein [Nanoarchaeota archaeon]
MTMEIIDTHAFYGRNEEFGYDFTLAQLKKTHEQHGVNFLAVSASPKTNREIADVVSGNDFLLGAYLQIVPKEGFPWSYTSPDEIFEQSERREIRGLKFIPPLAGIPLDSEELVPYLEIAEARDIPFLFHCSATGADYDSFPQKRKLIENHPDLKVIFAHFGGLRADYNGSDKKDYFIGAVELARTFPKVYLNTSGMSNDRVEHGTDEKGNLYKKTTTQKPDNAMLWQVILSSSMQDPEIAGKVLFGTDYPVLPFSLHPFDKLFPIH